MRMGLQSSGKLLESAGRLVRKLSIPSLAA